MEKPKPVSNNTSLLSIDFKKNNTRKLYVHDFPFPVKERRKAELLDAFTTFSEILGDLPQSIRSYDQKGNVVTFLRENYPGSERQLLFVENETSQLFSFDEVTSTDQLYTKSAVLLSEQFSLEFVKENNTYWKLHTTPNAEEVKTGINFFSDYTPIIKETKDVVEKSIPEIARTAVRIHDLMHERQNNGSVTGELDGKLYTMSYNRPTNTFVLERDASSSLNEKEKQKINVGINSFENEIFLKAQINKEQVNLKINYTQTEDIVMVENVYNENSNGFPIDTKALGQIPYFLRFAEKYLQEQGNISS